MSGSQREFDKWQQFCVTVVYLSSHVPPWEEEQHRLQKYVCKIFKIALQPIVLIYILFLFFVFFNHSC